MTDANTEYLRLVAGEDGRLRLEYPDGSRVPGLTAVEATCRPGAPTFVTATMRVNVGPSGSRWPSDGQIMVTDVERQST